MPGKPGEAGKASQRRKHLSWVFTRVSKSGLMTECRHSHFLRFWLLGFAHKKIEPNGAKVPCNIKCQKRKGNERKEMSLF